MDYNHGYNSNRNRYNDDDDNKNRRSNNPPHHGSSGGRPSYDQPPSSYLGDSGYSVHRPSQHGGGYGGHAPSQHGGGYGGHPLSSQHGGEYGGHLPSQHGRGYGGHAPSQQGGGYGGHAPSEHGGGYGRHEPSQDEGEYGGHPPSQHGGGYEGHPPSSDHGGGYGRRPSHQSTGYGKDDKYATPGQGGYGGGYNSSGGGGYGGAPLSSHGGYNSYSVGYGGAPPSSHGRHKDDDEGGSTCRSNKPTYKVYCKKDSHYSLSVKHNTVVLARADSSDPHQHWYKDEKYSSKMKDEEGFPCFALVNKTTNLAMKHSKGGAEPVQLELYDPSVMDESILWTQSKDLGEGYRTIRMVNNIRLNVDALHGDQRIEDGTKIVLWEWNQGGNQLWKIVRYCK